MEFWRRFVDFRRQRPTVYRERGYEGDRRTSELQWRQRPALIRTCFNIIPLGGEPDLLRRLRIPDREEAPDTVLRASWWGATEVRTRFLGLLDRDV